MTVEEVIVLLQKEDPKATLLLLDDRCGAVAVRGVGNAADLSKYQQNGYGREGEVIIV